MCGLSSRAANVSFKFVVANGIVDTNIDFTLTPVFNPGAVMTNSIGTVDLTTILASVTSSNSIWDSFNRYIGSNGVFVVSNLTPATYLVTQNTTRFYINLTNTDTGTYFASNLLTGITIAGANAVYTRGQSDLKYVLRTNGFAVSPTATNATLLGLTSASNISDFSIVTESISNSGPTFFPAATNVQTVSVAASLNFGAVPSLTNALLNVSLTAPALWPGSGSNSWEVTVTPPSNVVSQITNMSFFGWVSATNQITIVAVNAFTNHLTVPAGIYRVTARQWQ